MSIMAMLASALGGSAAAGGAASAATGAAASGAGSSFLGGLMESGASALSSIGTAATDAIGMTDSIASELEALNGQLATLREEAEFIKTSGGDSNMGGYANEQDRETDLAENAARTQEVINKIDELEKKRATSDSGLEGTLKMGAKTGSTQAPSIATGSVNSGSFDQGALVGAATSGLSGVLGGAPKTTQQQLIQAQHQAFGGFKV